MKNSFEFLDELKGKIGSGTTPYFPATEDRLGGVTVGDGLSVTREGRFSLAEWQGVGIVTEITAYDAQTQKLTGNVAYMPENPAMVIVLDGAQLVPPKTASYYSLIDQDGNDTGVLLGSNTSAANDVCKTFYQTEKQGWYQSRPRFGWFAKNYSTSITRETGSSSDTLRMSNDFSGLPGLPSFLTVTYKSDVAQGVYTLKAAGAQNGTQIRVPFQKPNGEVDVFALVKDSKNYYYVSIAAGESALELAQTNEHDIDTIDHIVTGIAHDSDGTPELLPVPTVKALSTQIGDGLMFDSASNKVSVLSAPGVFSYVSGALMVKDGGITTQLIADKSVEAAKLADASVTSVKIGPQAVGRPNIADLAVGTDQLAQKSVTLAKLADEVTEKIEGYTVADQTATVPSAFPTLRVSELKSANGRLKEGYFRITNTGAETTIPAETVFATGLSFDAKADSAPCIVSALAGTSTENTIELNDTGKSLNFTAQQIVPANKTVYVYVLGI